MNIRTVRDEELDQLNKLILRSKAIWGYDAAFMAACEQELSLCPDDLEQTSVAVAEGASKVAGVAQVRIIEQDAELLKLFVDPEAVGSGAGKALFEWSCDVARDGGAQGLVIESDPHAAPFYRYMGARDIGLAPSGSISGRMLPMLLLSLSE